MAKRLIRLIDELDRIALEICLFKIYTHLDRFISVTFQFLATFATLVKLVENLRTSFRDEWQFFSRLTAINACLFKKTTRIELDRGIWVACRV